MLWGGMASEFDLKMMRRALELAREAEGANEVPVVATIYTDDLYVERDFAEESAASIRGLRPWITNEFEHNGIRADGERVLDRLIGFVRGRV